MARGRDRASATARRRFRTESPQAEEGAWAGINVVLAGRPAGRWPARPPYDARFCSIVTTTSSQRSAATCCGVSSAAKPFSAPM